MNIEEEHINERLRQYLLHQDVNKPPEKSVLKGMEDQVFGAEVDIQPSEDRKEWLLARLKDGLEPVPGSVSGGHSFWERTSPYIAVIGSVALIAMVLYSLYSYNNKNADEAINTQPPMFDTTSTPKGDSTSTYLGISVNEALECNEGSSKGALEEEEGPTEKELKRNGHELQISEKEESDFKLVEDQLPVTDEKELGAFSDHLRFELPVLYNEMSLNDQYFEVFPDKGSLIKGKKGTVLYIPPNCFVDKKGAQVNKKIRIRLTEMYDQKDLLRSGTTTQLKNSHLYAGGVVRLEVSAGEERLEMEKGKKIYVEFAAMKGIPQNNMSAFSGQTLSLGSVNWKESRRKQALLIPLSVGEVDFLSLKGPKKYKEWNELLATLNNYKYENTFIATDQFIKRLVVARRMGFDVEIVKTYLNNLSKNLWQIDFMVAEKMVGDYRNYEYTEISEIGREQFQRFAEESWSNVTPYQTHQVNLNLSNAGDALRRKGLDMREVDQLLLMHALRPIKLMETNALIQKVKSEDIDSAFPDLTYVGGRCKGYYFNHLDFLGIYNPISIRPKTPMLTTQLKVDGPVAPLNLRVYLVYPGIDAIIPAQQNESGLYIVENIPKGLEATFVALGYQDGQAWLGYKKRKISASAMEQFTLKQMTPAQLKIELKKLLH